MFSNNNVHLFKAVAHYSLSNDSPNYVFLPNDSPSRTTKKIAFYFFGKAFFITKIFKFLCNFYPSFLHFPDSKGQMEVE